MDFTLSDFDYDLPDELIAQEPAQPRDHARLLVYDRPTGTITDDHFYNLPDYLPAQTTLTVNNSKVEKCRLLFEEGKREVFVLEILDNNAVRALVRPGRKFREGQTVQLTDAISVSVLAIDEEGIRTLKMSPGIGDPVYQDHRYTPFPPYIEQDESLSENYQTIYAEDPGSKAAPTAGLHFTEELISRISEREFSWAEITLHVGLGTFAPVKDENIDEHTMHTEQYTLDRETANRLQNAEHVTAVGTTSVRVLETVLNKHGHFKPESAETDIFIRPGYSFKAVDALITNFHLPKSTLLMLIAAFTGYEQMQKIYTHAIEQEYRFYSFGDAMLIR